MWRPCDDHDWQPARGRARYRCSRCFVLGYRDGPRQHLGYYTRREGRIVAYRCTKCHGPSCKQNAPCPRCKEDAMSNRSWDWKRIRAQLIDQGWKIEESDGRHVYCVPPNKAMPKVRVTKNSGDSRALKCALRDLKRSGFDASQPYRSTKKPGSPASTLGDVLEAKGQSLTQSFGVRLKDARIEHGFSQQEFGELIGTQQASVSRWERDACMPNESMLASIFKLLPELADEARAASAESVVETQRAPQPTPQPTGHGRPDASSMRPPEPSEAPPPAKSSPRNGKPTGLAVVESCVRMLAYLYETKCSLDIGSPTEGEWVALPNPEVAPKLKGRGNSAEDAVDQLATTLRDKLVEQRRRLDALIGDAS